MDLTTKKQQIAIIIPAYNEELTIQQVMQDFHDIAPSAEIIVINNRSTDDTGRLAQELLDKHPDWKGRIIY